MLRPKAAQPERLQTGNADTILAQQTQSALYRGKAQSRCLYFGDPDSAPAAIVQAGDTQYNFEIGPVVSTGLGTDNQIASFRVPWHVQAGFPRIGARLTIVSPFREPCKVSIQAAAIASTSASDDQEGPAFFRPQQGLRGELWRRLNRGLSSYRQGTTLVSFEPDLGAAPVRCWLQFSVELDSAAGIIHNLDSSLSGPSGSTRFQPVYLQAVQIFDLMDGDIHG